MKKQSFPDTPAISYESFEVLVDTANVVRTGILTISYQDGNGDIGLSAADRVGDKTLWKKTEAREKQMAESISAADNVAKYGKYASPEALKIMSAQPKGMTPEAEALQKSAGDKDIKVSFDPATLTVILKDENGKTIQEVQTQLNSQQSQINAITGNIRPNEVKTKT